VLYGVDVHGGYQAGLDFPTLKRQGYTFAAVKASQGTSFVGPQFADWIRAGRAAGLVMGAYHWIERGNAAAQCDHFLSVLATVGGPDGLLIQLDCEDDATWTDVQAWIERWNDRTAGHPVLIYTGAWWWGAAGRRWPGVTLTPYLWDSHYLTADTDGLSDDPAAFAARIPASWWTPGYGGWPAATILQFTSKGDAGKIANNVDLNATKLTRDQLLALTHSPKEPAMTAVEADLVGGDDARLKANTERIRTTVAMLDETPLPWTAAYDPKNPTHEPNDLVKAIKAIKDDTAALVAHAGAPIDLDALAALVAAKLADNLADATAARVLDGLRAHPLAPTT
jgi:lysozyme